MKAAMLAAAALCVAAGAALVGALPEAEARQSRSLTLDNRQEYLPALPSYQSAPAPTGCALTRDRASLNVMVAPRGASYWTLSVRGDGVMIDQDGGLASNAARMERVSRVFVLNDQPFGPRSPLEAALRVYDAEGRQICADVRTIWSGRT